MTLRTVGAGQVDAAMWFARDAGWIVATLAEFVGRLREQAAIRRLMRAVARRTLPVARRKMLYRFGLPCINVLTVAGTTETGGGAVQLGIVEDLSDWGALQLTPWPEKTGEFTSVRVVAPRAISLDKRLMSRLGCRITRDIMTVGAQ